MVGADVNYQFIDWAHPKINDEVEVGEHLGTLMAYVINPSITIGLSDYWNFTFSLLNTQLYNSLMLIMV